MTDVTKIDVHHHLLPPFWVDYLQQHPTVHRVPQQWTPARAIDSMDTQGIAKALLSLSVPGVGPWPVDERPKAARAVNDYAAELVAERPERFGALATLPLPDVDAALVELERAFDTLAVDGVIVFTNYGERFLGDSSFEPLWAELDRRGALVLIHPDSTTLPAIVGMPAPLVDFPFATTRTAVDMVFKGVMGRYRNMNVVLSHAGGFLPYVADRIARGGSAQPGMPGQEELLDTLRRFYLDTALSTGPMALPSLTAFAEPGHILFGSDHPYAAGMAEEFTAVLDSSPQLSDQQRAAITHLNAAALLSSRRPV